MHNHNNQNGGHKGMMWMMIPCLLMIAVVLLGGNKLGSSKYLWLIVVGVCVVPHLWMMFKGRGCKKENNKEEKSDTIDKEVE